MLRQNASAEGSFQEPSVPPAGSRPAPALLLLLLLDAHLLDVHGTTPPDTPVPRRPCRNRAAIALRAGASSGAHRRRRVRRGALLAPPYTTGCALAAVGAPLTPAAAPGVAGPPPPPLPLPLGLLEPESKPRLLTLSTCTVWSGSEPSLCRLLDERHDAGPKSS